jgi:MFS family permease
MLVESGCKNIPNPFRIRTEAMRPFTAVWLSHMLVEVFLLMHPALVPVFMSEFGLSVFQAGLLITIPNLCRLAIVIPTGILADKFGPKRFIILSLLIGGSAALFLSQSTSALILMASLSMIMISATLYHPPGLSIVSGLFPNQAERSTAIGLHGASGCIGQALGTISLGLLLAQYGWRFCYLVFSIPLLVWMLVFARMRISVHNAQSRLDTREDVDSPDKSAEKTSRNRSVKSLGFFLLMLSMGFNALANNGVSSFMTTYMTQAENLSVEIASIIFGAGPLIGIVGSIAAGYVSSRFGDKKTLVMIYLGQAVFLVGLIVAPSVYFATFSFLMYQLFLSALWTPSTSMVASLMGRTSGGTAYSLFYFSGDALGAVSPMIAAILITSFNLVAPFVFAIALLISCTLLVQLIRQS